MSQTADGVFEQRVTRLQQRMADEGIDLLLMTDPASIYYLFAYWGDLG